VINPDYHPARAHLPSAQDLARWKAYGRAKWKSEQATRDRIAARIARAQSVATSQGTRALTMHCTESPDGYGWEAWVTDADGDTIGEAWGTEPHEARDFAMLDAKRGLEA
jgi:hypothetical protein